MENIYLLALVTLVAVGVGFALKANGGQIKKPKTHENFSSKFNKFGSQGSLGTLIQFSTEYCSICPSSKKVLTEIASQSPGVEFIEIDAEKNFDFAKKLSVLATPTVLIINKFGDEIARFSGKPKKDKLRGFIKETLTASSLERKSA
jgi:thiol-disulfide isomerase/thioredoxin